MVVWKAVLQSALVPERSRFSVTSVNSRIKRELTVSTRAVASAVVAKTGRRAECVPTRLSQKGDMNDIVDVVRRDEREVRARHSAVDQGSLHNETICIRG